MNRVNVVGTTGSGKSTFSKALADVLEVRYVQLDELFWQPDWQESADEEFLPKVEQVVSEPCWVLDGNYSRTNTIKWPRADTVIWLDFGYFTTFRQLLFRTLYRALSRSELWPNTGNRESFKRSFFDRSSILLWFFRCYRKNRAKYLALMNSNRYPNLVFVRLTNPGQARQFIEQTRESLSQHKAK